jgi:hypothetical protein
MCHSVTLLNVNPNWCTVLYAKFFDPEKFIFTCQSFRSVLSHSRVFCIVHIVNSSYDVFFKVIQFASGFGLAFFFLGDTKISISYSLLILLHTLYFLG